MTARKEKSEVVEVAVKVRITYSSPEAREVAIREAQRELHMDMWSSQAGGISCKRVRP